LQLLQNASQINGDNLNNATSKTVGRLNNKKGIPERQTECETNRKNKISKAYTEA
jgi:hypothetical protein